MSADEYARWRRYLWYQRGPNVATPTYEDLLPCYKKALDRCAQLAAADGGPAPAGAATGELTGEKVAPHTVPRTPRRRSLVRDTLRDTLRRGVASGAEDPFYVIDLERALERLAMWRAELPEIEPFYAVKCNGDPALLLTLAHQGVNFDCASHAELKQLLDLGVSASRLVYANPIKQPSHLRFARQHGVDLTVFDGVHELHKLAATHPTCKLLLRIAVDDSQAQCVLSNKYGADPREAESLLDAAAKLGLTVAGVSFHVGSGTSSGSPFRDAVSRAAEIFSLASERGRPMTILDVGGGFPGVDGPSVSFGAMAADLRDALRTHFPPERGVRLIAEPGRFFAASTHTLAVSVIGKKVVERSPPQGEAAAAAAASSGSLDDRLANSEDTADAADAVHRVNYYINDGLYGSFNCVLYDHASPTCEVLCTSAEGATLARTVEMPAPAPLEPPPVPVGEPPDGATPEGEPPESCVWGPTCDGIDCVMADARLPALEVGSWLYFTDMGAYTACAGSNFNGMSLPDVMYLQARGAAAARPLPPAEAAKLMLRQLTADGITPAPKPSGAVDGAMPPTPPP